MPPDLADRRRWLALSAAAGVCTLWPGAARPADGSTLPTFTPFDTGAVGDGVADDTQACNAAAARAAERGGQLVFPSGTFRITSFIVVKAGVRRVEGRGGVILCGGSSANTGLLLAGRASGQSDNVRGCEVRGLRIDCGATETVDVIAIYGQNTSNCVVVDNHIFNLVRGHGVLLRSFAKGGESGSNNQILNNRIERPRDAAPRGHSIEVDAELADDSGPLVAADFWMQRHIAAPARWPTRGNRIIGNRVVGGYYGVALGAASGCTVSQNTLEFNTRSISIQNGCLDCSVTDNDCIDSQSSSIHLAYGSSRCRILRNRVRSRRAVGEGLLQAYVGCTGNLFEGNEVTALDPARPKYMLYCALQSSNNRFVRNTLAGPCSRAYVAVESSFNGHSREPMHYAFNVGKSTLHMGSQGMAGVVISDNQIDATSPVPVFYLAQVSDELGGYELRGVRLERNHVSGPPRPRYLQASEDSPGLLSGLVMEDNTFPADASKGKFKAARDAAHFVGTSVQARTLFDSS